MLTTTQNRLVHQCSETKQKLLQKDSDSSNLRLVQLLEPKEIQNAFSQTGRAPHRSSRIFNPTVTIWIFLTQILSTDSSCRNALCQWIALLASKGQKLCSSATGGYAQARLRLPVEFFKNVSLSFARQLHEKYQDQSEWTFRGRPLKMADGTTITIQDTPQNRKRYPMTEGTLGYPLLRLVVLISFSTGAWLDMKIGPHIGKGSGEGSLFLKILMNSEFLQQGDILLVDRLYSSYLILGFCNLKGVDVVTRQLGAMKGEKLKSLKILGEGDRLVELKKPHPANTTSDPELLKKIADTIILREITYYLQVRGFRTKKIVIMTSLLDPHEYPASEIATLYYFRWNCELDLRNIKTAMQMDTLRCKTPEMIEKELWMYQLGYNLVRASMAQAALSSSVKPRELSFKGTLQILNAFRPHYMTIADSVEREKYVQSMFQVMGQLRLVLRPFRIEPRAIKKRKSSYPNLKTSRAQARTQFWKKGDAYYKRKKDMQNSTSTTPSHIAQAGLDLAGIQLNMTFGSVI